MRVGLAHERFCTTDKVNKQKSRSLLRAPLNFNFILFIVFFIATTEIVCENINRLAITFLEIQAGDRQKTDGEPVVLIMRSLFTL